MHPGPKSFFAWHTIGYLGQGSNIALAAFDDEREIDVVALSDMQKTGDDKTDAGGADIQCCKWNSMAAHDERAVRMQRLSR